MPPFPKPTPLQKGRFKETSQAQAPLQYNAINLRAACRGELAPSRNSQQESSVNLFIVQNKSNRGDWTLLKARSEGLHAGPWRGWVAAGTGLCRCPRQDTRCPALPQPGSVTFPSPRSPRTLGEGQACWDPSHPTGCGGSLLSPHAPSPSHCTEHRLTWFQPVFLHD